MNKNIPQNDENRGKNELPRGLRSYELIRDFVQSRDTDNLYHYSPRLVEETGKPCLTEDGKADKRDFSWTEIFPKAGDIPIAIEIGSGKGNFLEKYSIKHPEKLILGTEWEPKIAHYASLRIPRNNLTNAKMLRGDVFFFLRDMVPDNSVDEFHMYFPDPWPKAKHHKNRLALKEGFFEEVYRVLKPGKRIFYWGTDHQEYNELAVEHFESIPFIKFLKKNDAEPTDGIMTNFEIKYREEGRPIYRSILEIDKKE